MKWRIFAAFAGLLAVTLLAQDIPLASYLRDVEYARTVTALERDAFIIAGSSEDILAGQSAGTLADLETSARMYHANHRHTRVIIVDAQGRLVVNSDGEQPGADYAQSHPGVAAALKGTPTPGRRESGAEGDVVFVAVPVLSGTDVVGAVRISHPWDTVLDDSRSKQSVLVLAFAISMIAALVVSFVMALSLSRPLHRLRRSTERLARGDFTERADESTGPPEFRSLAASFNKMTMQVDQLMRQQRDFAGDASHQLRSPLTALRLRLEQASIDMAELDESEESTRLHVGLTAALAETERLQRLIDGLLMLARAEPTIAAVDVDLSEVLSERGRTWAPLAEEREVNLVVEASDPVIVRAGAQTAEQIVDNYLDNALSVSPPGSTITLRSEIVGDWGVAHVLDEGPGLQSDQRERAFDRFWRAPDATYVGSGIGLAIVERLAAASRGDAALDDRIDVRGIDAIVRLPLADSRRGATPSS